MIEKLILKSCSRGQLFLLLSISPLNFLIAQKTQIIDQSNFKHNSVLERAAYLEELHDTVNCKYIATLNLESIDHPGHIELAMNLLEIKTKELGANVFYISSYSRVGNKVVMTFKIYYAFKKAYELNKSKNIKNKIVVFSFMNKPGKNMYFYLNDSLKNVRAENFLAIDAKIDEDYNIKSCNTEGITINKLVIANGIEVLLKGRFKYRSNLDKQMEGVMLYSNEFIDNDDKTTKPKQKVFRCGLTEIEYRVTKVLMEVYKPEK